MLKLKQITGRECVTLRPGDTVYDQGNPLTVESVHWFGDYGMDVISCSNGRSYPATSLEVLAAVPAVS